MKIPAATCNNTECKLKDNCLRFTYLQKADESVTLHTFKFTPQIKDNETICKGFVLET